MQFHQTQKEVARDKHRFRVVVCGRQWGKTTLAIWEMIGCAYAKKDREIAYFATTFDQARNIAWQILKKETINVWSRPPNESRLELYIRTQDGGESRITLRGFENIETARGQQFDFLVIDEVVYLKNWKYAWQAILEPTLGIRRGEALFISTPNGYDHFHEMYMRGQQNDLTWKSWHFTTYQNPYYPVDLLEQAKKDSTNDYFSQEYLADFVRFTGLIYKEFSIADHVETFDVPKSNVEFLFGLDFAVRGFTAMVSCFIDSKGDAWIFDNYKEEQDTAKNHSKNIKDTLSVYAAVSNYTGYADPAGWMRNQQKEDMVWAIADEYVEDQLPITKANNQVTAGINYVRQLFKNNKIHIHTRCQKLIEELLQYQWKDQPTKQQDIKSAPEEPRKIHDHLVDAMRYMLFSKPMAAEEEEPKRGTVFPGYFPPPKIEKPSEDEDQITPIDFPSIYD